MFPPAPLPSPPYLEWSEESDVNIQHDYLSDHSKEQEQEQEHEGMESPHLIEREGWEKG